MSIKVTNTTTMSSKEIALLTGKDLSNIHRDIRIMLAALDDSVLNHEQYQEVKDTRGYTSEFLLNHDLTVLLLTGYDVKARLKVIQRWKELEAEVVKPVALIPNFTDPAEAAIAWATEYKAKQQAIAQVVQQQMVIEQQQPAVEFVQRHANTDTSYGLRETAKILNVKEHLFIKAMLTEGILFRDASRRLFPSAKYQHKGYFQVNVGLHTTGGYTQCRFTPKGLEWMSKLINS